MSVLHNLFQLCSKIDNKFSWILNLMTNKLLLSYNSNLLLLSKNQQDTKIIKDPLLIKLSAMNLGITSKSQKLL